MRRMAKQITGAKLLLAGGHQISIGAGAVAELVKIMETRPEAASRIVLVEGNELLLHWSQISAIQIFSAGK